MSLPSGYKSLEYIKSTGTQYIDTGFTPDSNSRVDMVCEMLSASESQAPFMTRNASNGTYMFGVFSIKGVFRSDYGSEKKSFGSSLSTLQKLSITRNKNVCTIGTTTITNTATTFTALWPLFLFASDDNGTAKYFSNAKLYSCQVYDNDVLVRYFIPCIKDDGEVGLYDLIGKQFYGNAGTGTFAAGPVVAIAADSTEVTELKYIQSSGTQYIDTLFTPNQDTRLTSKILCTPNTKTIYVLGARTSPTSNAYCFICSLSGYYAIQFGTAQTNINPSYNSTSPIEIDFRKSSISINGVVAATPTSSTFTAPCNLTLFGINTKGSVTCATIDVRFYDCKIYDNGTLIRDYTAAKLADGTVGLYDKLHGLLYINMGTGTFDAGPEVCENAETPTGVVLTSRTENSISFQWDDMVAESYRIYKNGVFLEDVSETSYTDSGLQSGELNNYAVSSLNGDIESSPAHLGYVQTVIHGVSGLVTDRTIADVSAVKNTTLAILSGTATAEQITEFSRWMKGAYSDIDLNRVEDAVSFIAQILNGFEADLLSYLEQNNVSKDHIFFPEWVKQKIELITFVLWQESKYPVAEDMARYLSNVSTIREALPGIVAPSLPDSMDGLDYKSANAIEEVLIDAFNRFLTLSDEQYALADRAVLSFVGCNEFGCGEV